MVGCVYLEADRCHAPRRPARTARGLRALPRIPRCRRRASRRRRAHPAHRLLARAQRPRPRRATAHRSGRPPGALCPSNRRSSSRPAWASGPATRCRAASRHTRVRPSSELVYGVPQHRAIVVGDVLLGDPLRICPPGWVTRGGQKPFASSPAAAGAAAGPRARLARGSVLARRPPRPSPPRWASQEGLTKRCLCRRNHAGARCRRPRSPTYLLVRGLLRRCITTSSAPRRRAPFRQALLRRDGAALEQPEKREEVVGRAHPRAETIDPSTTSGPSTNSPPAASMSGASGANTPRPSGRARNHPPASTCTPWHMRPTGSSFRRSARRSAARRDRCGSLPAPGRPG